MRKVIKKRLRDKVYINQDGILHDSLSNVLDALDFRVYVVNTDKSELNIFSKDNLMSEAERLGTVYSLERFMDAFNFEELSTATDLILMKI